MLVLDSMSSVAGWSLLEADGVTPSAELTLAIDASLATPGGDTRSAVLSASASALDHSFRRTLAAPVDLGAFDELRLVVRADRIAQPGDERPFFLEMRLGSAALPVNAAGNSWHRRLPIARVNTWEVVRLSLDDLPAAVRNATSVFDLRVIDDEPFECRIDEVIAVRASMLADIETTLVARLHQQIDVDGGPVDAELAVAGEALSATRPAIFIVPYEVRHAPERSVGTGARCDFTVDGYRVRAPAEAYSADYILEARATTRASQSVIVDFLLNAMPPRGEIRVAGLPLAVEAAPSPVLEAQGLQNLSVPRQLLTYRVFAWQESGAMQVVRPTQTVVSQVEWMGSGHA
jgi:hypothetical protein